MYVEKLYKGTMFLCREETSIFHRFALCDEKAYLCFAACCGVQRSGNKAERKEGKADVPMKLL